MDKKVFKYKLGMEGMQKISLPMGSEILAVHTNFEGNAPCIWALVDPDEDLKVNFTIRMFGTGHRIEEAENLEYIDTVFLNQIEMVVHVFEEL